jgi:hypothetical protein
MTNVEILVSLAGLIFGYVCIWGLTSRGSGNDQPGGQQEKEPDYESHNYATSEKEKSESSKSDESSQNKSDEVVVRIFSSPSCAQKIPSVLRTLT